MPINSVNGVRLFSEWHGETGAPVVLVHGSWGDHHNWNAVVPGLARTFRVLTYDRRGHSQSERLASQGSVEEDVADLEALITTVLPESPWVTGIRVTREAACAGPALGWGACPAAG